MKVGPITLNPNEREELVSRSHEEESTDAGIMEDESERIQSRHHILGFFLSLNSQKCRTLEL